MFSAPPVVLTDDTLTGTEAGFRVDFLLRSLSISADVMTPVIPFVRTLAFPFSLAAPLFECDSKTFPLDVVLATFRRDG